MWHFGGDTKNKVCDKIDEDHICGNVAETPRREGDFNRFQPISFDWNTSFLHLNPECRHILWFSRHQQKQKAKSMFSCWKAKNKLVILCNCKPKKELARGKGKDGVFYAVLKLSFSIFCNWSAFIRRSILLCLGITRRFFTLLTSALSKQIKQWQIFWNTHKHMQKIQ